MSTADGQVDGLGRELTASCAARPSSSHPIFDQAAPVRLSTPSSSRAHPQSASLGSRGRLYTSSSSPADLRVVAAAPRARAFSSSASIFHSREPAPRTPFAASLQRQLTPQQHRSTKSTCPSSPPASAPSSSRLPTPLTRQLLQPPKRSPSHETTSARTASSLPQIGRAHV